jgi:sulfate permease, SulP family
MILAGLSAIDFREARSIWTTGAAARSSMAVTFVATLVLSVPMAIGVGVLLSAALYVASSASDINVRVMVPLDDGGFAEEKPPSHLPSDEVTVLAVYGSLFFAGAHTLGKALPNPGSASRPVVVLRLRGRTRVGATLIEVLDRYADDLAERGGRLYLSGVEPELENSLRRTGKLAVDETVRLVPADAVVGASTTEALASARAGLGNRRNELSLPDRR